MEGTYLLAMRGPAFRRHDSYLGFRTELENRVGDVKAAAAKQRPREGFNIMARVSGREVIVYDKTRKSQGTPADVIYHKTATGEVSVHIHEQIERFATSGEPQIDLSIF